MIGDHDYLKHTNLRKGDGVMVLGACRGEFMYDYREAILAHRVPVVNVEPNWELIPGLLDACKAMNGLATVLPFAVGNSVQRQTFVVRESPLTGSLVDRPETNQRWPSPERYTHAVHQVTLQQLLSIEPTANIVACDIEGSELEAVASAYTGLRQVRYIAIAAYHLRDGRPTHERLEPMLREIGFKTMVDDTVSKQPNEPVLFGWKE